MTENTEVKIDQEELKRYLYAELSKKKAESLENEFFQNDELFFEVVDLENELVEQYTRGKLEGAELSRFEKSLDKFPERQQKIANARALHTYIEEERPPRVVAETQTQSLSFWQKLAGYFTIQSPLLGSAMAGLLVIFMVGAMLLFLDGRQKREELARLQNEKGNIEVWQKRENELKEQLNVSNQQLKDLENQLAEKDDDAGDFTRTLIAEREKKQQLEKELTKLRQEINKPVPTPKSEGPTIASIIVAPRGTGGGRFNTTSVGDNTKKLAVNVALPDDVKEDERFSIQLNGQPFKQNVAPNKKSINLTIPIKNLNIGENKLSIINKDGKEITNYTFTVDKPND